MWIRRFILVFSHLFQLLEMFSLYCIFTTSNNTTMIYYCNYLSTHWHLTSRFYKSFDAGRGGGGSLCGSIVKITDSGLVDLLALQSWASLEKPGSKQKCSCWRLMCFTGTHVFFLMIISLLDISLVLRKVPTTRSEQKFIFVGTNFIAGHMLDCCLKRTQVCANSMKTCLVLHQ